MIYEVSKAAGQVPLFIAYVTACIAVSLAVYIFALRNKAETPSTRNRASLTSRRAEDGTDSRRFDGGGARDGTSESGFYVGPDQGSSASCTWRYSPHPTLAWSGSRPVVVRADSTAARWAAIADANGHAAPPGADRLRSGTAG